MKILCHILLWIILNSCLYEKVEHYSYNNQIIDSDSLDKNNNRVKQSEGYIVGFDPCTVRLDYYDKGYVIISTNLGDTLLTYNFPDRVFDFPAEYFANYMNSGYFPEFARYEFKVQVTYYIAEENQKIYLLCPTDYNQSEFKNAIQIVIKTVQIIN